MNTTVLGCHAAARQRTAPCRSTTTISCGDSATSDCASWLIAASVDAWTALGNCSVSRCVPRANTSVSAAAAVTVVPSASTNNGVFPARSTAGSATVPGVFVNVTTNGVPSGRRPDSTATMPSARAGSVKCRSGAPPRTSSGFNGVTRMSAGSS